ncbi:MAG: hypothetical protein WDO24_09985 [Pseudomonadota bacterium]
MKRIDDRDDGAELVGARKIGVRKQQSEHRRRIDQTARLDHHAVERGTPLLEADKRIGKIAADRAAKTAIAEQHDILARRLDEVVIEVDVAELVDHGGDPTGSPDASRAARAPSSCRYRETP